MSALVSRLKAYQLPGDPLPATRLVAISEEDVEALEEEGMWLCASGAQDRGARLLNIVARWRVARGPAS